MPWKLFDSWSTTDCSESRALGVSLAPQAADSIHFGVDNLGVVRHVGCLLDGNTCSCPVELVHGGDLIILNDKILDMRGRGTVRVAKVKGHDVEGMVWWGFVSLIAWGTMRLMRPLTVGGEELMFPLLMLDVTLLGSVGDGNRFFIAVARSVVNHDGGKVLRLIPWSGLLVRLPKGVA